MYVALKKFYYESLIAIISTLPDFEPLELPKDIQDGINNVFDFLGWVAPYDYYKPLFTFILALTVFRMIWALVVTFKN